MDNIPYPRALNRPTYLVWRFTHKDVTLLFITFAALVMPGVFDSYPVGIAFGVWVLFVIYRGAVVTLKPRGWEKHTVLAIVQPKSAAAGHTFHRCFIRDTVEKPQRRWWHRVWDKISSSK